MNFIKEITWRGMLHTSTPDIEEVFQKPVSAYIGFDPTSPSLHIGSLATIMLLVHLQRCGHFPIALLGGATGMIGDPSGKKSERAFLSDYDIRSNAISIKKQLSKFIDLTNEKALVVNNSQWYGEMSIIQFLREIGKFTTVNTMLSKDSVKNRLEEGISFTEFSYQLLQGYDFHFLFKELDVIVQLGGSDQWGNMTAGIELIRKKENVKVHALTMPLLTKPDGSKFGKSEEGNIWLDRNLTTPFQFYQYWLNTTDEEVTKLLRIFTLFSEEEILALEQQHSKAPHQRLMQKTLASDVTSRVHSVDDTLLSISVSQLLFGKVDVRTVSKETWQVVETAIPTHNFTQNELNNDFNSLLVNREFFTSKSDMKRTIQQKGLKVNGETVSDINFKPNLFFGKYIHVQKGKIINLFVLNESISS